MRRTALTAMALLVVLAAGCARKVPQPAAVEFWQSWPEAVITPLVNRFEAENPGVRVHVVVLPREAVADSIAAALAAGHPPDLCEIGSGLMPRYLAAGTLSDWSAGVADLRDSLLGWPLCMVGDAIYGLPWQLEPRALYFNKTLLGRAGLAGSGGPETWDQLAVAVARIQRLGHGVHGFGVPRAEPEELVSAFLPFAWGNGGEVLSSRLDSSRFDSPQNVRALEFYVRLRKSGFVRAQDSLEREFAAGRLGLLLSGTAFLQRLASPAFQYGVALVPRPATEHGEHASLASGALLASFTGSKRKENALRLARFLVRPENVRSLAILTQAGEPPTIGADSAGWYRLHPDRQALVRQLATARYAPRHAMWDSMEIAIDEQVGLALDGSKSAALAVADADARLAELAGRRGR